MAATTATWVGQTLAGRYRVTSRLGEGGMATIYLARDQHLGCDVVLKVPHAVLLVDPQFARRFAHEVRSLVQLAHPHIIRVMDVGEHQGVPFAVMQYLSGGSLEDRRRTNRAGRVLPGAPEELPSWLEPIAAALDFIHQQQYIHRDVKPGNILFDAQGNAYLSDFGVAKVMASGAAAKRTAALTGSGIVLGTPEYMAPELIMGEPCDGRIDQYALAVTVHELLNGSLPFTGPTAATIFVKQTTEAPPPLHELRPTVPEGLSQAVLKALSKNPDQRYPDCAAFARAVRDGLRKTRGAPTPSGKEGQAAGPRRKTVSAQVGVETPAQGSSPRTPSTRTGPAKPGTSRTAALLAAPVPRWVLLVTCLAGLVLLVVLILVLWPATSRHQERSPVPTDVPLAQRKEVPPPPPVNRAEDHVQRGIAASSKGDDDGAIQAFSEAIRLDPNCARAYAHRGAIHDRQRRLALAIKDYQEALRLDPTLAGTWNPRLAGVYVDRGRAASEKGQYDEAIGDFSEGIKLDPNNAQAHHARGVARGRKGDLDQAIADFSEALRLDPKSAPSANSRGYAYLRKGDLDRALADLSEAIRLDPKLARAYHNRGDVHVKKSSHDRAIADFNEALRLDPKLARTVGSKCARAYSSRGWSALNRKEFDQAIADYNQALRLDAALPQAFLNRGVAYYRKGDLDRAFADFSETIRLQPRHALAYSNRGGVYNQKGDLDRALTDLNEAIRLDPKLARAYDNRGNVHVKKNDHEQAIADYSEALRLDPELARTVGPKCARAHYNRGLRASTRKDYNLALADYSEAIRLDPSYVVAYGTRGMTYALQGQHDRAIADFSEAIRLNRKFAPAYSGRAAVFELKKDYNRAVADYTQAIRLEPRNGAAYAGRARAYRALGQYASAAADERMAQERK
jgi:tetratricopeptide (TPR) repeat protein/serine/threonine protein kinase